MKIGLLSIFAWALSCSQSHPPAAESLQVDTISASITKDTTSADRHPPKPGIYTFAGRHTALAGKRIAVVANHTSIIEGAHLVDTLLGMGAVVVRVFAPEHGFRGDRADGAHISDALDARTGLQVVSLYGKNKKPLPEQMSGIEHVVFDIQDVGARFYTYLSTLHYVMEACAEAGIPITVLDRPNPNIHYVDGPVLMESFKSFVGMHPVPIVYGMTIGEYALMINGEGWLSGGARAELEVVPCLNYSRSTRYHLQVPPSPNLQGMEAIYLYPSLCLFEGTTVSVGRGTQWPFTVIGEPGNRAGTFEFTPLSIPGVSDHPPHKNKVCRGYNLRDQVSTETPPDTLQLQYLVQMYQETPDRKAFFLASGFFDKLAGTDALRKAIIEGYSESEIRTSWKDELSHFKTIRARYLIYEP